MPPNGTPADAARDRRKITSRKMRVGLEGPGAADDSLAVWAERYLALAVRGARSAEVAGKITRHLASFHAFLAAGLGHDRVSAVTPREVAAWREHLAATVVRTLADGRAQAMAPATVNNHLAHLSAFFTWTAAHAPAQLLPHGDPTTRVALLRLPAPEPRALSTAQVRTLKNVLDRLDGFHQRTGRRHRGAQPGLHRHARPLRDRAIVHLLLGTGLRRAELVALDLGQLEPSIPEGLRRARRARLRGVRGKGRTSRTVFLGLDARQALADYLDRERPGDADQATPALFVAARSIAARAADGRLSPRSVNTIVAQVGRVHDLQVAGDPARQLGTLTPHDLRHTFAFALSQASGHNRAELERRLGHANDRYLRLYTNPPEEIAAGWVEDL
jgi:site-specific recombinase XerD